MRQATVLLTIIILCASFALAEVAVITTEETNNEKARGFLVEETNSGIKIEAMTDVGITYVYINGQLVEEYESISNGETESIRFDRTSESEVEIRFLKEYSYIWDSYDITKNEISVYLDYLKYDKDNKYVKFSLNGGDIIHPQDIEGTKRSVAESLTDYVVKVDDEINLNCYPKISTGEDVYFKCKCSMYPHVIDISTTLGVSEKVTIPAKNIATNEIEEDYEKEELKEPIVDEVNGSEGKEQLSETNAEVETSLVDEEDQESIGAPEETTILDNISMTDTLLESKGMSNAVKFLILMLFLALTTLMFVASHHKHENKKAGLHHPHKKKKKK